MAQSRDTAARKGRLVVCALLPLAIVVFAGQSVLACGATLHYYIGDVAKEKLDKGSDLRNLIQNNRNAYQMGLVFPDLFFGVADTDRTDHSDSLLPTEQEASHYTHSPAFFTEYAQAILERCEEAPEECDDLKAHFLGVIGHIVADVNYDNRFVTSVWRSCYHKNEGLSVKSRALLTLNFTEKNLAQHFTDQIVDGAAFQTIPPEEEFKETRKLDDPDGKVGKAINRGQEWRDKQRRKRAKKREGTKRDELRDRVASLPERVKLWGRIRPKWGYVPAGVLSDVLADNVDVGRRNLGAVLAAGAAGQWERNNGKAVPGTKRASRAFKRAKRECPDAIDYDSDEGWYWGPGGVDETAEILAEFQEAIWAMWEKGEAPEFRAGPCRIHEAPHDDPLTDRGGKYEGGKRYGDVTWNWLHKNLCMRVSWTFTTNPATPPQGAGTGTSSAEAKPEATGGSDDDGPGYVEHCMYPEGTPTHKRARKASGPKLGTCGVIEIENE